MKSRVGFEVCRKLPVLVVLFALFALPLAAFAEHQANGKPWDYKLGEGLRLSDTSIRLGGYIAVEYEDTTDEAGEFVFDDLSFFLSGDLGNKLRFFSEIEDSHFLTLPLKGNPDTDSRWQIERLYADYLYKDTINFRAGKFLAPIGRWNEVHADPLTLMATRPIVSLVAFPEFITGLQMYGNLDVDGEEFSYNLVAQNNESINERTGYRKTHMFYAGRIRWHALASFEASVPFGFFRDEYTRDDYYFTGYDFVLRRGSVVIESEGVYSIVDLRRGGSARDYGYYMQVAYSITEKLFAAARHEFVRVGSNGGTLKAVSAGLTYRPVPQVALKTEYQVRYGNLVVLEDDVLNDSDKFVVSFSVLF